MTPSFPQRPSRDLLSGCCYPFRAWGLLQRHPKLLTYLVFPLAINLVIGGILYLQLLHFSQASGELIQILSQRWLQTITEATPSLLPVLTPLVSITLWLGMWLWRLLLLMLTGLILSQVGGVLGSPWYGALSETLEKQVLGKLTIQEVGFVQDIGRAILFELKKLALLLFITLFCFALNLVPGVGTLIATVIGFLLTGTLTCLDFFDPPLERRRLRFRQKLQLIVRSLPASAGFGGIALVGISIPLVNLVAIPICVAAGTLFFCEQIYPMAFQAKEASAKDFETDF